jgi:hypothetical protein
MKGLLMVLSLLLLMNHFSIGSKQHLNNAEEKYQLEAPEKFILNSFKNHDIIFLGEPHHIKQNLNFLIDIIPKLYENGITNLGYEFLPYDRQNEIDQLLNSKSFDRKKAEKLVSSFYLEWTEKEYVDVLYCVWQLNSKLKTSDKKFRVIGINNSEFWGKDRNQKWTEKNYADCIVSEIIDKNEKALVYCGTHHSITKFQQPYYDSESKKYGLAKRDRVGHYIYSILGDKCMTIWFHHFWPGADNRLNIIPCGGVLDSLSKQLGKPFAFNTSISTLGNLIDNTSIYSKGYVEFNLKLVADGYIVLNPICDSERNDYSVNDPVDESNVDEINEQTKYFYDWPPLSPKQINDSLLVSYKDGVRLFKEYKLKNCP